MHLRALHDAVLSANRGACLTLGTARFMAEADLGQQLPPQPQPTGHRVRGPNTPRDTAVSVCAVRAVPEPEGSRALSPRTPHPEEAPGAPATPGVTPLAWRVRPLPSVQGPSSGPEQTTADMPLQDTEPPPPRSGG